MSGQEQRILVVVARFYDDLAEALLAGALPVLESAGCTVEVLSVPGAFEVPAAISMGVETERFDGYVALGCVIRGETTHYDYVCTESARGINDIAMALLAPIGYGILTVENEEQAWERADPKRGNKGGTAARACLMMLDNKRKLGLG
jgi:6,7-dimethyl-8-ribityllumazine synthase